MRHIIVRILLIENGSDVVLICPRENLVLIALKEDESTGVAKARAADGDIGERRVLGEPSRHGVVRKDLSKEVGVAGDVARHTGN